MVVNIRWCIVVVSVIVVAVVLVSLIVDVAVSM